MQPTNMIDIRAEVDYRRAHLTEQYRRPGARERRGLAGLRSHLHWHPRRADV